MEETHISDDQFLDLCQAIFNGRERALMHQLGKFKEGVLGVVFDDLDRVQHMFRRDRMDIVENWYEQLDALVGRVENKTWLPWTAERSACWCYPTTVSKILLTKSTSTAGCSTRVL